MSNSTQSRSNTTTSATTSSAGGNPPVPSPIGGPANDAAAIGPVAALRQQAATLQCHTNQVAVVAREAVADAMDINNGHNVILSQHRKMFLASALHSESISMARPLPYPFFHKG
jgi:hypothetical protein